MLLLVSRMLPTIGLVFRIATLLPRIALVRGRVSAPPRKATAGGHAAVGSAPPRWAAILCLDNAMAGGVLPVVAGLSTGTESRRKRAKGPLYSVGLRVLSSYQQQGHPRKGGDMCVTPTVT